jgi:superfamily I DNA and/or RNA helicase/very-short-patch-repair endonuclease
MNLIAFNLSKGIKEAKWLAIDYKNANGEKTSFWISIKDILIETKEILVDEYNVTMTQNEYQGLLKDVKLKFERILSASYIEGTTYSQPDFLIEKIENNLKDLSWLEYENNNNKIVNYIRECIRFDTVPYQNKITLVSGIDDEKMSNTILEHGTFVLSSTQKDTITNIVMKNLKKKESEKSTIFLVLSLFGISTKSGFFMIAYKNVLFDPAKGTLNIVDKVLFNYEFSSDSKQEFKHNLKSYLDMDVEEFVRLFNEDIDKAKDLLQENLRLNEKIDDRPYFTELAYDSKVNIDKEFNSLIDMINNKDLSTPLKAFFGNMNTNLIKKKRDFQMIVLDDKLNIDQLRVVHNALRNPITYVQGPPGTGKTHSIVNLVFSALFNEKSVLITSNNNKPIDDIHDKIMNLNLKFQGRNIPLPILRLGNKEKILDSIKNIVKILDTADEYNISSRALNTSYESNKKKLSNINELIDLYEKKNELIEAEHALETMVKRFSKNLKTLTVLQSELNDKKLELKEIKNVDDETIKEQTTKVDNSFLSWLLQYSIICLKKIETNEYSELREILNITDNDRAASKFNNYISKHENLEKIIAMFPIILTTNLSTPKLGLAKPTFDVVIIDEAGQSSLGYSLFPMLRAKSLLLVGDQNQLSPVITLPPEINVKLMNKYSIPDVYNYIDNSILKTMQSLDSISKFILLRHHYRSQKDIIEFSNQKYYLNKLIIETKLKENGISNLAFIDTSKAKEMNNVVKNTSLTELSQIIEHIKTNNIKNAGIITPFRNQANRIQEELDKQGLNHITAGTIHTFQGDEKDIIYLSCSITDKTTEKAYDWVKNNKELINVAMTRAKENFILVGNKEAIVKKAKNENSDLMELLNYVDKKGQKVKLTPVKTNNYVNSANFKQYNTATENELFETINHALTLNTNFEIKEQVPMLNVFVEYPNEYFDYFSRASFDFVLYEKKTKLPRLVIELDGAEHITDQKVKNRDAIKEKLCKEMNLDLIRIPNNYSRRYIFVKEIIKKLFI